jgi:copper chaperone CopZ
MKRQVITFGFLIIIASMIFGSMPNYVLADSQSDTMIRIAQHAQVQLKMQLSKTDASEELRELFTKGSKHLELLIKSSEEGNIPEARKYFLSAMEIYREISQMMTEQPTQETTVSAAQVRPSFSNEIERLESYIDRLEAISIKNKIDVDFSKINDLIDNAKNAQSSDNYEKTKASIAEIKQAIIELQKSIKEKTRSSTTEKAKTFAQQYLSELDRLIVQAKDIGVSDTTLKRLESAKANLHDASDVKQIIKEVKEIMSVKADFEAKKAERINSRINQLETKFERLDYAEKDDSYNNAERMISELKRLVSEDKLSEAIDMINSLNRLLQEMETKQPEPQETVRTQEEDYPTSLEKSKGDRVKATIERLENQLEELKGQIKENAAADRWLNNAISQLETAKSIVDDSQERALEIIKKVEQIIKRVKNISQ